MFFIKAAKSPDRQKFLLISKIKLHYSKMPQASNTKQITELKHLIPQLHSEKQKLQTQKSQYKESLVKLTSEWQGRNMNSVLLLWMEF